MRADCALTEPGGADLRSAASRLNRAHEQFMLAHRVASSVRPVVAASWQRCAEAGLGSGGGLPPVRLDAAELAERRSGHPLAEMLPMFREMLGDQSGDCDHIFAITDAAGTLLWVEGDSATRRRAERMNFVAGAAWSEADAGTNAPGTALALLRPVQIVAAEHYNTLVHRWSCAAAPVRDPVTGQVLGVIDITGGDGVASRYALSLVQATGRLAEAELTRRAHARGEHAGDRSGRPSGPHCQPRPPGAIALTALGRDCALLETGGRTVQLRPRHSEIAVILALAGTGLPGPRLAVKLSEIDMQPVTLRAEMSRLRALLGAGLLGSHPYEFRRPVCSDFATVQALLERGDVAAAVAAYPGPLLPSSQSPAVTEYRAGLEQQLRAEVLASGDARLLRRWVTASWGADDIDAWQTLAAALPAGSPQRSAAAARARALDREIGGFAAAVPILAASARPGSPRRSPAWPDARRAAHRAV